MKTQVAKNLKAGFSLVEMLVVIAVIGVIAAIAVPTIGNITGAANTGKAKRNAQNLASVYASAIAAGSTGFTGDVSKTDIADSLIAGVTGGAEAGLTGTEFRVKLSDTERDNALAYLDDNFDYTAP